MIVLSLQSGSAGNCYYYESHGIRLLFDAGIAWRTAAARLAKYGLRAGHAAGLFVSHDHSDHTCGVTAFHRLGQMPLFMSRGTRRGMGGRLDKIKAGNLELFSPGDEVEFGAPGSDARVRVETFATPHDATEPCAFIIDDGETRVGIFTDLGGPTPELRERLCDLDVAYLESNYDDGMLARNLKYSELLKRRIRGPRGHLGNVEAAQLVHECCSDRTQLVVLVHLSAENNSPEVALATHNLLCTSLWKPQLAVAPRYEAGELVRLGK